MSSAPTDETSRIALREIHLTDWPAFHDLMSDAEVIRFLDYGPFDEAQTREWLSHLIVTRYDTPRIVHHFSIEITATREIAGWIAVTSTDSAALESALSYAMRKRHWGRGYMTEAIRAAAEFAFGELGSRLVWAECDTENPASARVLQKSGFVLDPASTPRQLVRGEWREMRRYVLRP